MRGAGPGFGLKSFELFLLLFALVEFKGKRDPVCLAFLLKFVLHYDFLHGRAVFGFFIEAFLDDIDEAFVHGVGDLLEFFSAHFLLENLHFGRLEGVMHANHFVQNYADGPHVGLLAARFVLPKFRRQVKRSAYFLFRFSVLLVELVYYVALGR